MVTIIDIEPAISLSRWYLGQLFEPERLSFLTPAEVDQLPRSSANLGLSVSSLQEMTYAQVEDYMALLDHVVSGGTVHFKQRRRWHNAEDDLTLDFDQYPIPAHWRQVFRQICPVQTSFIEAAWQV